MADASHCAREAMFRASPNPRVGCVITDVNGVVLGRGSTQAVGGAHAEIMALRDAQANGRSVVGSTVYVTLEPCSHQGHTGPCCDALIEAGVAKVVASHIDPNPLVGGKGFDRLRAAGVAVEVGSGAEASRELNIGFFSRMLRKTPWVRLKVAASLDGLTALPNGKSQWITGSEARDDGHVWRARSCAILTGIGTILSDDPRMDVRAVPTDRQPSLLVVDSALRTPLHASLFRADRSVRIYTASGDRGRREKLEAQGATVIELPDKEGRVDLPAVIRDAVAQEINELHVEAGSRLNGALVQAGLVDELLMYLAPKLMGEGKGVAQLPPLETLSEASQFVFHSIHRVGEDLRILARCRARDDCRDEAVRESLTWTSPGKQDSAA